MKNGYIAIWGVSLLFLVSCKSSDILTGGPSSKIYESLSVFWGGVDNADVDLKLEGNRTHLLDPSEFKKSQIQLAGIIESNPKPRDIVLVVDISGSMTQEHNGLSPSDPIDKNGSCARLKAVKAVIETAKAQSSSRFALVTFNSYIGESSGDFFANLEELLSGQRPEDILCRGEGGTNYTYALGEAIRLINRSPSSNLQEVYFITDGEPSDNYFGYQCDMNGSYCNGRSEADYLKSQDIILGTVMLGNSSLGNSYLENFIAGLSPNGDKLHAQAEVASQLPEIISELSRDPIVSGSVYYRSLEQGDGITHDILQFVNKKEFRLSHLDFDKEIFPEGLELQVRYKTARGFEYDGFAFLKWQ